MARTLQDMALALQMGRQIGDPIAQGIMRNRQRQQQLQDNDTSRNQQFEDFARAMKLKQLSGEVGGFTFPEAGRTVDGQASVQAIPMTAAEQADPGASPQLMPVTPGVLADPQGVSRFQEDLKRKLSQQALDDFTAKEEAKQKFQAPTREPITYINTDTGIVPMPSNQPISGDRIPTGVPLTGQDQKPLMKRGGAGRGLTDFQKASINRMSGKFGVDPEDAQFKDGLGQTDWTKVAFANGQAEFQKLREENHRKLDEVKGADKATIGKYFSAQEDLQSLKIAMQQAAATGSEPGLMDQIVASSTKGDPTGFFGSVWQIMAKSAQSDVSKTLEGLGDKAGITILNALSGVAVTEPEKALTASFRVTATDSFKDKMRKLALTEEFVKNKIDGISKAQGGIPPTAAPAPAQGGDADLPTLTPEQAKGKPTGFMFKDVNGKVRRQR